MGSVNFKFSRTAVQTVTICLICDRNQNCNWCMVDATVCYFKPCKVEINSILIIMCIEIVILKCCCVFLFVVQFYANLILWSCCKTFFMSLILNFLGLFEAIYLLYWNIFFLLSHTAFTVHIALCIWLIW